MAGQDKKELGTGVVTSLVVGILFFVGGLMIGLSVGVLVAILAITAVATVAVFVLS